jgi:hypothetical protein
MSEQEFADKWGAWARSQDRDLKLVRQRWIEDLEHMLRHAEREDEAVVELVAAKDAYRDDPSEANRQRKADAVAAVQALRFEERANRTGIRVAGDAYVTGV